MREIERWPGQELVLRSWRHGMAPDPALAVWEWADQYRILSSKSSAEAGPYRTDRTPYLQAIMEDLSPRSDVQRVAFMKAAQVGATECGNNWIGFCIHHSPASMMVVWPTVETAKSMSQGRIDPMIADSPELAERVMPARSRDSANTIYSKAFPGGQLKLVGANSAVGLRAQPVRYLMLDEVDGYPLDVDGEGDPISLALARTRSYGYRSKVFMASTPTVSGVSRIEREFELTDRRYYHVPCPHCGELQHLKFAQLKWERDKPETARYECEHCQRPIDERYKTWMLDQDNGAKWVATAKPEEVERARARHVRGYHLNGLYSPLGWYSWPQVASNWLAAQNNDAMLKAFVNTTLGECWQDRGDAPDWERLFERRESSWQLGTVPDGVALMTAGADIQRDRIEVSVWGWAEGSESWLVDHVILLGSTARPTVWKKLDRLLVNEWPSSDGESSRRYRIARLAVDTGDQAEVVYQWIRRASSGSVIPIKGVGRRSMVPVEGPTQIERTEGGRKIRIGINLWSVSVDVFKAELYQWLRLTLAPRDEETGDGPGSGSGPGPVVPPPGYVHLPDGTTAEWCRQLTAERLVQVVDRRGFTKLEWQLQRPRNEALDCRVYARAAAWLLGIDHWTADDWRIAFADTVREREERAILRETSQQRGGSGGWLDSGGRRRRSWLGDR